MWAWEFSHHFASVVRPSVVRPSTITKKNLLLWNCLANFDETLVVCSLGGPLPKLCLMIPTSNQDGRQAINRKKGGWNFKNLLWNYKANPCQTLLKWSLGGPFSKLCPTTPTSDQYDRQAKNRKKGDEFQKSSPLNYCSNFDQTLLKWCLGSLLPKLCPAFPTPDQDGRHSRT